MTESNIAVLEQCMKNVSEKQDTIAEDVKEVKSILMDPNSGFSVRIVKLEQTVNLCKWVIGAIVIPIVALVIDRLWK